MENPIKPFGLYRFKCRNNQINIKPDIERESSICTDDTYFEKNEPIPKMQLLKINYVQQLNKALALDKKQPKKEDDIKPIRRRVAPMPPKKQFINSELQNGTATIEKFIQSKQLSGLDGVNNKRKYLVFDNKKRKNLENIQYYFDSKSYEKHVDDKLYGTMKDSTISSIITGERSNSWNFKSNPTPDAIKSYYSVEIDLIKPKNERIFPSKIPKSKVKTIKTSTSQPNLQTTNRLISKSTGILNCKKSITTVDKPICKLDHGDYKRTESDRNIKMKSIDQIVRIKNTSESDIRMNRKIKQLFEPTRVGDLISRNSVSSTRSDILFVGSSIYIASDVENCLTPHKNGLAKANHYNEKIDLERYKDDRTNVKTCGFRNCRMENCPMTTSSVIAIRNNELKPLKYCRLDEMNRCKKSTNKSGKLIDNQLVTNKSKSEKLIDNDFKHVCSSGTKNTNSNDIVCEKFSSNRQNLNNSIKYKNVEKLNFNGTTLKPKMSNNKKTVNQNVEKSFDENCVKIYINKNNSSIYLNDDGASVSGTSGGSLSEDYGYYDEPSEMEITESNENKIIESGHSVTETTNKIIDNIREMFPKKVGCDGAIFWNDCFYYDEHACCSCRSAEMDTLTRKKNNSDFVCVCGADQEVKLNNK